MSFEPEIGKIVRCREFSNYYLKERTLSELESIPIVNKF